jgi:hypothetical protein
VHIGAASLPNPTPSRPPCAFQRPDTAPGVPSAVEPSRAVRARGCGVKSGWHSKCPTLTAMSKRRGSLVLAIPLAVLAVEAVAVALYWRGSLPPYVKPNPLARPLPAAQTTAMQFSLRTLLTVLALAPPLIAWMMTSNPGIVILVMVAAVLVAYLCWIDGSPRTASPPRTIKFTAQDAIAITGIALMSCLAGFGLWLPNNVAGLVAAVALFVFGIVCYCLGSYIHSRRQLGTSDLGDEPPPAVPSASACYGPSQPHA